MRTPSLWAAALLLSLASIAQTRVTGMLCENLKDPLGVVHPSPRLSWRILSERRNTMQSAYEVRVALDATDLTRGANLAWKTGKVASDQSVHLPYAGSPLKPGTVYHWQVRVWDDQGKASPWSAPAKWQTGLLEASDWKAKWIGPGFGEDSIDQPSPYLRRSFKTQAKKITQATAYVTALGMYEGRINGKRIGDAYLTPGWTSYGKRLQYQQYDVTDLLRTGDNAVGVVLGSGWYRGFIGFSGQANFYGKRSGILFQLDILYADGSRESVVSDDQWTSSFGSIQGSEIYHGERIDNRLEKKGWDMPGYSDMVWTNCQELEGPFPTLVTTVNETVKKHETFKPLKVITTPKGEQVIDFGQNLVGWVQVRARGQRDDSLVVTHAEVLDKAGNFYTENLRAARQRNVYILNGEGEESFEPHFTFQGFRYIRIEGLSGPVRPEDFTAVALYSAMPRTGTFTSSNELLNKLQHNIEWGLNGNFLDVPTDCPQRDERLGWTGDAQAFARTATFNRNVNPFFAKWLKDLAADQLPNGSVPFVIPNVLGPGAAGACGWADAATIIPWTMYLAYADTRILEDQYESMKAWVGYIQGVSRNDLWNTGFHFGDWLFYTMGDDNAGNAAVTDRYLLAQAFYGHSVQLLAKTARVLGRNGDAARYDSLSMRVKEAFNREYVSPNGRVSSNTQTAYVLALQFDMLPESMRAQAAQRLVENIRQYGNHLTTGFLGTPYLCHVLSRFGHTEVAFTLLMQETYPSWLYPVKMGATTIWERWNGIRPDGSFEVPSMNSFNHYAYGAIGEWMYRSVAGLDTDESGPGYRHVVVKPHIGGGLGSAKATLETYYGTASSGWEWKEGRLRLSVTVPPNARATLHLPVASAASVTEGGRPVANVSELTVGEVRDGRATLRCGSGSYLFEMPFDAPGKVGGN